MSQTRPKARRGLIWVVLLAALVILIDQFSKWLARVNLEGEPTVQVIGDLFRLTFIRNPGAAFSFGTNATWVFTVAASVVSVVILFASLRVTSRLWLIAMGTLLGGAVGNLIDRFAQPPGAGSGHVVDFIEMPFLPIVGGTVFNVADIAVVGAAIFMVILSLIGVEPNPTGSVPVNEDDIDEDVDAPLDSGDASASSQT